MVTRKRMLGRHGSERQGAIAVVAIFLLVIVLAFLAFAVDLGYLYVARNQAQRSADSAALAAASEFLHDERRLMSSRDLNDAQAGARGVAIDYAARNGVVGDAATVSDNADNSADGDVVLGRFQSDGRLTASADPQEYNGVLVRVRRTESSHGQVPLFFGPLLGVNAADIEVAAIAAFRDRAVGFRPADAKTNTSLLPFTIPVDLSDEDVEIGYVADLSQPGGELRTDGWQAANAVRVRVRRTDEQNGEIPLFFARVIDVDETALQAEATAALLTRVNGFQTPANEENVGILPFALDLQTWNALVAGGGSDSWRWDPVTKTLSSGADGVREVNLYPQGTGSPGNRGTVDIGSNNNSTSDIARQIRYGVSPEDLEHHGGKLEFDANGELELNGDTGISAGVKDDLAAILGQTRIIPIFNSVQGPGNNAQYTIVKFVGVRVLDVKLTGSMSSKRLTIQPANVIARGGIPAPSSSQSSAYIYSPAWLIR